MSLNSEGAQGREAKGAICPWAPTIGGGGRLCIENKLNYTQNFSDNNGPSMQDFAVLELRFQVLCQ